MAKGVPSLVLSPELLKEVCDRIRLGAYEHVAVESVGIPFERWEKWKKSGANKYCTKQIYKELIREVRIAKAHARFMAEAQLKQEDPKVWLTQGPGKETGDNPGWTIPVKPRITSTQSTVNILNVSEQDTINKLLKLLAPYPEARKAVADGLSSQTPNVTLPKLTALPDTTVQGDQEKV